MSSDLTVFKSCEPQLFPNGEPEQSWGLDALGHFARHQDRLITEGEKSLATRYWLLGAALHLARGTVNHGLWEKFLEKLEIDKTRAAKAQAIHRTFDDQAALANVTVDHAYGQRTRQKLSDRGKKWSSRRAHQSFSKLLQLVAHRGQKLLKEPLFSELENPQGFLNLVSIAVERLVALQERLQDHDNTSRTPTENRPKRLAAKSRRNVFDVVAGP